MSIASGVTLLCAGLLAEFAPSDSINRCSIFTWIDWTLA